jgi:hypothetical protein
MNSALFCGEWKPTPPPDEKPEAAAELPEGVTTVAAALQELAAILAALKAALERQARSPVDRITFRLDELAESLGVSRRIIERERAAGRWPRPDLHIGKMSLWKPETIRRWIEGGGRS